MGKEENFLKNYKAQWDALEAFIRIIDKKGYSAMTPSELKNYLHLMKRTSHHLAFARTHFSDSPICQYLNGLSVRANNHLYVVKKSGLKAARYYLTTGFAIRVQKHRGYILLATGLFVLGFILCYWAVHYNNQIATFFIPEAYLEVTDETMPIGELSAVEYSYASSTIMANNIKVTITVFVYGLTAGIGSVYILLLNGANVGAFAALAAQNASNMANFWAQLLPHGMIELTAIFISGGAGLMLGKSLLIPGPYKRKDALIKASKEAVMLLPGVFVMLIIAGFIEGFFTPTAIHYNIKLIFAGFTGLIVLLYFCIKRKNILEQYVEEL